MSQAIRKTILIVCEGGGTESSYFESIRDILIDRKVDIDITISPIPKNEVEAEFKLREGAKKRELKKIDDKKEKELRKYEIEEDHKAQPVRYVREAQMGLQDGSFDEVWAVYDKNGHPKHKEALDLASKEFNGKKVNIAFSSISFEHWVLLHHEKCNNKFIKSKCRDGDMLYQCGTNVHDKDCKGTSCVCGYLITKKYLGGDLKKKQFLLPELPSYKIAIKNAISLRSQQLSLHQKTPIYEINPITTVDRLVFRLLNLPIDYCWFELNVDNTFKYKNVLITVERGKDSISFTLKNLREGKHILLEDFFILISVEGQIHCCGKREVVERESQPIKVAFKDLQNFIPAYFGFSIGENQYQFSDL